MNLFTADIDWAPEEVIEDTLALFKEYNVCCTLFATHDSSVMKSADKNLFETGLHPNFNPLFNGVADTAENIIAKLKSLYPDAVGVRSHSLTQSGGLLNKFKEAGLLYEVNHFLPYHQNLMPFTLWNGMLRIPFNWEDDYHFALNYSFEESRIDFNDSAVNIYNFHPIHIYLNSENNDRYLLVKDNMKDIKKLREARNETAIKGTRDILISLLKMMKARNDSSHKLSDIYYKYKNSELFEHRLGK